jgi:glycosyltransferase involved in cell wall biosynthesis
LAIKLRSWHFYKPIGLLRKLLVRPDAYGDWVSRVVRLAKQKFPQKPRIDAILASGPPNSAYVAAARLSEAWGKPLIMDMRDPWNLDPWYKRLTKSLEKRIYENAAAIIVNTEGAAAELKGRHPEMARKIKVICNGFDPEDLNWQIGPALRQTDDPEETVHILNLGGVRGGGVEAGFLKILADYLQDNPAEGTRIRVHFVGGSAPQIEKIAAPLGLSGICKGYGLVPTNNVGRPLAEADIYTLLQPKQFTASIPSKFFHYLAGGGYILAQVPEILAEEIREKMGDSRDVIAFVNQDNGKSALAKLLNKARQSRRPIPGDSFPPYAQVFDRRQIARQVASVLDEAVGSPKTAQIT